MCVVINFHLFLEKTLEIHLEQFIKRIMIFFLSEFVTKLKPNLSYVYQIFKPTIYKAKREESTNICKISFLNKNVELVNVY